MSTLIEALCLALCFASGAPALPAVPAIPLPADPSFGSSGAQGALVVPTDQERVIDLATEGVYLANEWLVRFDYTSVQIGDGATVRFLNHPSRAPVAWFVQGGVSIGAGARVVLDGLPGKQDVASYAEPGPGGFRGGRSAVPGSLDNASAGLGPGGALGDVNEVIYGGSGGAHRETGTQGQNAGTAALAKPYGHPFLVWLAGGSGGGAGRRTAATQSSASGGGAGGGALWIAADGLIVVNGALEASGGAGGAALVGGAAGGGGSGGALHLSSWTGVELGVGGQLQVSGGAGGAPASGGAPGGGAGSGGRIRIESPAALVTGAGVVPSIASVGEPEPPRASTETPRLRVVTIGGQAVPSDGALGAGLGGAAGTPDVSFLNGTPVDVVVEVENLPAGSQVWLRVTRAAGAATVYGPQLLAAGAHSVSFTSIPIAKGVSAVQARATEVQP